MIGTLEHIEYIENEPLFKHCTFRTGGNAKVFAMPKNAEEIKQILTFCQEKQYKYMFIGNGSNILFPDEGYDGVIICLGRQMSDIRIEGNRIYAQAGALLSAVAKKALQNNLTGMEFAAGIPGSIGGAACMNAGAYGGEMKDIVKSVTILEATGEINRYTSEDMKFAYRHSVITENPEKIVLEVEIELQTGDYDEINGRMKELATARISKQPLEYPSAGSTFKRPEGYFAGKLIDDAGLRGYRVGGAMVSEKHCGFVINYENATTKDILQVIHDVQACVCEKFGVTLETEVKIV